MTDILDQRKAELLMERAVMTKALVNFIAYQHYRRNCATSSGIKQDCTDNAYTAKVLLGRHGGTTGLDALEAKLNKSKSFNKADILTKELNK